MNKTEYVKAIAERLYNNGEHIYMEIKDFVPVHQRMNKHLQVSAGYATADLWGDEITLVFTKGKNPYISWIPNVKVECLKKIYENMPEQQPKRVVHVVIRDSVVDFDQTTRILMTTPDIGKAKECLKENVEQIKEIFDYNCCDWITEADTDMEFRIYEDGRAVENHEYIWIEESAMQ